MIIIYSRDVYLSISKYKPKPSSCYHNFEASHITHTLIWWVSPWQEWAALPHSTYLIFFSYAVLLPLHTVTIGMVPYTALVAATEIPDGSSLESFNVHSFLLFL